MEYKPEDADALRPTHHGRGGGLGDVKEIPLTVLEADGSGLSILRKGGDHRPTSTKAKVRVTWDKDLLKNNKKDVTFTMNAYEKDDDGDLVNDNDLLPPEDPNPVTVHLDKQDYYAEIEVGVASDVDPGTYFVSVNVLVSAVGVDYEGADEILLRFDKKAGS